MSHLVASRLMATAALGIVVGLSTAQPASAQGGTSALHGKSISASVSYQTKVRSGGREVDGTYKVDWHLNIGGDGSVSGSATRAFTGPQGTQTGSRSIAAKLAKPGDVAGSGHQLMVLSGNTLTILRTFEVGGSGTKIRIAGGGNCAVASAMMKEVGAGTTRRESPAGGSVEVISARQVSSSCRIQ